MEFEYLSRLAFIFQISSLIIWLGGYLTIFVIAAPLAFRTFSSDNDAQRFIHMLYEKFHYFILLSIFLFILGIIINMINSYNNPLDDKFFRLYVLIFVIMCLLSLITRVSLNKLIKLNSKNFHSSGIASLSFFKVTFYLTIIINSILGIFLIVLNKF